MSRTLIPSRSIKPLLDMPQLRVHCEQRVAAGDAKQTVQMLLGDPLEFVYLGLLGLLRFSSADQTDPTAETVGQKLNTKNLVQLKVAEQLSWNDSPFRAPAMLSYAGRHNWEPVFICVVAAQNEEARGIM